MAVRAYLKAPSWQSKLWAVVFLAWPMAEMLHAAMRISAISYLFGLANAIWIIPFINPKNRVLDNKNPVIQNNSISK
jgi:hypothetical protein